MKDDAGRRGVIKRSLLIAGHATSISLEDAFWVALKSAAVKRDCSVAALVALIDIERGATNLSSAIRVFLLKDAEETASIRISDPAA